jgi:hypothetical protein
MGLLFGTRLCSYFFLPTFLLWGGGASVFVLTIYQVGVVVETVAISKHM